MAENAKLGIRSVLIDTQTTKSVLAAATTTLTWTRAENVPPRFSTLHVEASISNVLDILTSVLIKSGDELVRLDSAAAIEAWCNRAYKDSIALSARSLAIPLDFPEPRLKGQAEVKAVTEVQLGVTNPDQSLPQNLQIGFEQVFPIPPAELRVISVNQNLSAGANSLIQLPRYDGKLKSVLFNTFTEYQRLRIKNAQFGVVIETDADFVRSRARKHGYFSPTIGAAVGYDFDINGDVEGMLTREQLEMIAQLANADANRVYFETYR